jgi:hypothetical protein
MSEHDEMMDAFTELHGTGNEYTTGEEHEMWLGWLGCFTLGWDACKKYLENKPMEVCPECKGTGFVTAESSAVECICSICLGTGKK